MGCSIYSPSLYCLSSHPLCLSLVFCQSLFLEGCTQHCIYMEELALTSAGSGRSEREVTARKHCALSASPLSEAATACLEEGVVFLPLHVFAKSVLLWRIFSAVLAPTHSGRLACGSYYLPLPGWSTGARTHAHTITHPTPRLPLHEASSR